MSVYFKNKSRLLGFVFTKEVWDTWIVSDYSRVADCDTKCFETLPPSPLHRTPRTITNVLGVWRRFRPFQLFFVVPNLSSDDQDRPKNSQFI